MHAEFEFKRTAPDPMPPVGLGDAVAKVAQPIARAIDRVFKTNVANCGACAARQAALNAAIPDALNPFRH